MKLARLFAFDSGIAERGIALETRSSAADAIPAGLEEVLRRLRYFVDSGKGSDPEILALASLLCVTGESFQQLCNRVYDILKRGRCDPEARAALVAAMGDMLAVGRSLGSPVGFAEVHDPGPCSCSSAAFPTERISASARSGNCEPTPVPDRAVS